MPREPHIRAGRDTPLSLWAQTPLGSVLVYARGKLRGLPCDGPFERFLTPAAAYATARWLQRLYPVLGRFRFWAA